MKYRATLGPTGDGLEALAEYVRELPEGGRNNNLYWAAIRAAEEDHQPDDIHALLLDAALAAGLTKVESARTIRSGLAYATRKDLWATREEGSGARDLRGFSVPSADDLTERVRRDFPDWPADWPTDDEHWRLYWAEHPESEREDADLFAAFPTVSSLIETWDPAKDAFTVERLLRPGYRCLIAAYEGVGKTYLAMQLALHFAYPYEAGAAFGEFDVNEALSVLYVDMEVGTGEALRRLQALARELSVNLDNDAENLRLLTLDDRTLSLKDKDDLAFLAMATDAVHGQTGRKVVLFLDSTDSLYGKELWGAGAEPYDEAIRYLMTGRREWLIVVTLVHTVKKPREQKGTYRVDLQDVLGNVTRQADSVLILDAKDDLTMVASVSKRPGRSRGILQRDKDGVTWRWTKDVGSTDFADGWKVPLDKVLAAIDSSASASGIFTQYGVTKRLEQLGTKVDKNTVGGYLKALVTQGRAAAVTDGNGYYMLEWGEKAEERGL